MPAAATAVTALTDTGWPRDIMSGQTKITIYQPQIDTWDGFRLTSRAAVAVTEKADTPPIYGIIAVRAEAHIDKDERLVSLEKITIESASFPSVESDKARQWALAVQARATKMRPLSLERFEAAVAVSTAARKGESVPVKNEPPVIHVSKVPSMLILVDGDPVYRDVSGTPLTRVLNTRPLILKDGAGKHYLKVFDGWMTAPALVGPWTVAGSVPGDVDKALKVVIELKVADLLVGGDPNDPASAPSLKKQAHGDPAIGRARPATCTAGGDRRRPLRDGLAATTRGPATAGRARQDGRTTRAPASPQQVNAASSETSTRAIMRQEVVARR